MRATRRRVAVIGLDCGTPRLFDKYAERMPHLRRLRADGLSGSLRSTMPPITVPAWSCMMSGRTPGELGIYGFRNRLDHSYDRLGVATSRDVHPARLWDIVDAAGGESVLLGVPGTYPAPRIRGTVVGDFLSSKAGPWTHPATVADDLAALVGDYVLDVTDFRTHDKERVAQQLFDMTEQRFRVARHLAHTTDWDLFAMVDMGLDRLHHGFWSLCEEDHPDHDPDGPYVGLFGDYYAALDRHLGELLDYLDDDVLVVVASDHGGQPMAGGVCVNQWLLDRGWLVLERPVEGPTPIADAAVDWSRTVAWADGGYYARVFLNVAGREPAGVVAPADYESVRTELARDIEAIPDHLGRPLATRAIRPEEAYPEVSGVPPDLLVLLDDLRWRSVGALGLGQGWHTFENDTGPDDANHAEQGVLVLSGDGVGPGALEDASIYDVAPTLQHLMGLPAPPGQGGQILA